MKIEKREVKVERRGRPAKVKNLTPVPSVIDFSQITRLNKLNIDKRMLESMPIGVSSLDKLFSHEGGLPCSTNIMAIGDPGVGKTSVMLDIMASIQNKGRKCLFISGEMGRKQMFKYTERFKQFGVVDTLFTSDFMQYNTKDVIEQSLDLGYDCVLIDSIAEVIEGTREDNGWDRKTAESWLVEVCFRQNKGENKLSKFTSFLLIQQVTKAGEFVGSNKLKHMVDGMVEMRRDSERDGGGCSLVFTKNRNGDVNKRVGFELSNNKIDYGILVDA
jgi:predicted ATP-dependent serine protease